MITKFFNVLIFTEIENHILNSKCLINHRKRGLFGLLYVIQIKYGRMINDIRTTDRRKPTFLQY